MSAKVTMPALGESVTEGTVTRWLKAEGDTVAIDEPLLEVSTDKVDTEIPSPYAGVIEKILVPVDSTVLVGADLVIINDGSAGSAPAPVAAAPVAAPVAPAIPKPTPPAPPVSAPAAPVAPVVVQAVASPVAPTAVGAATIISMPALGESVSEGTVTRWLKNVGDAVAVDEALLEVSTDKVDTEIPSPVAGTLLSIDAPADTTVPVGARLASIGVSGAVAAPVAPAQVAPPVVQAPPVVAPPAPVAPAAPFNSMPAPVANNSDLYVTPLVRKIASDAGIDLATVRGTGVGGRIRKQDVYEAAERARVATPVAPQIPSAPAASAAPVATSAPKVAAAASPLRGTTVPMSRPSMTPPPCSRAHARWRSRNSARTPGWAATMLVASLNSVVRIAVVTS